MPVVFTWSILPNGLRVKEKNGNPDTVVSVLFQITAADGNYTADIKRAASFQSVDGAPFTPFSQLSEQQVIEWVKASIPANIIAQIEKMLIKSIEQKKNPPVRPAVKPAPWSTCSQG
jgi:hypothetical protein